LNPAIFLDRDGVLVEDVDLLTKADQIHILEGVANSLRALHLDGFLLVVVSNQPVVARGLISEDEVIALQREVERRLMQVNGITLDGFYFCPHHPNATLAAYRQDCACRKPKPGMLIQAAKELRIDLRESFMVGDRITDIVAGAHAGCRTILVQTGKHLAPPIQTIQPIDFSIHPDYTCQSLAGAACWILKMIDK